MRLWGGSAAASANEKADDGPAPSSKATRGGGDQKARELGQGKGKASTHPSTSVDKKRRGYLGRSLVAWIESLRTPQGPASSLSYVLPCVFRLCTLGVLLHVAVYPPHEGRGLHVALASLVLIGIGACGVPLFPDRLLSVDLVSCLFESLLLHLVLSLTTPYYVEVGGWGEFLLCAAYLLAYLVITQNCYPLDPSGDRVFSRLHNRLALLPLLTHPWLLLSPHPLPALLLPPLLHAATYPFHNPLTNAVFTAGYLMVPVAPLLSTSLLLAVVVYGVAFVVLHCGLSSLRGPLNGFLLHCPLFTFLDLQTNLARVRAWGLGDVLASPTLQGAYACYMIQRTTLAGRSPHVALHGAQRDEEQAATCMDEEIERHFLTALASVTGTEGSNVEGRGRDIRLAYAQWLARSPDRRDDAMAQYRRVLECRPCAKEALEGCVDMMLKKENECEADVAGSEALVLLDLLDRLLLTHPHHRAAKELYGNSLDCACLLTADGRVLDCNAVALRCLGGSRREDVVGRELSEWLDINGAQQLQQALITGLEGSSQGSGRSLRFHSLVRSSSKHHGPLSASPRLSSVTVTPRRLPALQPEPKASKPLLTSLIKPPSQLAAYVVWVDECHVSSRHEALFQQACEPMVLLDRRGRVCEANGRMQEVFGYSLVELLGRELRLLFEPSCSDSQWCELQGHRTCDENGHVMAAGPMSWRAVAKDGTEKWLEAQLREVEMQQDVMPLPTNSLNAHDEPGKGSPNKAEGGEEDEKNFVRRFLLVLKDVTDVRELTRRLADVTSSRDEALALSEQQAITAKQAKAQNEALVEKLAAAVRDAKAEKEALAEKQGKLEHQLKSARQVLKDEKALSAFLLASCPSLVVLRNEEEGTVVPVNLAALTAFAGSSRSEEGKIEACIQDGFMMGKNASGQAVRLRVVANQELRACVPADLGPSAADQDRARTWMILEDVTEATRLRSLHSLLLSSVRSCVLLLDHHGAITHANALCQTTFKYTQEELYGMRIADLVPTSEDDELVDSGFINRYKSARGSAAQRVCGKDRDGRRFRLQLHLHEADVGLPTQPLYLAVLMDVEEFEEMAAISRVAFDSSLSPLVILDQNFDMIRMNEAAHIIFRYSNEMLQAPAERHVSRLQPDGFRHYPASPHALSPQTVMEMSMDPEDIREIPLRTAPLESNNEGTDEKKTVVSLRCFVRARSFQSEGHTYYALLFRDITGLTAVKGDLHDTQKELQDTQALCSALVEGLMGPACVLRRSDGMVLEANHALTSLVTGRGDRAALVGHPCRRVFSTGLPWDVLQEEADDKDGPRTVHVKLLCADDEAPKHWAARLMPLPRMGLEKRVLVSLQQDRGDRASPNFPLE